MEGEVPKDVQKEEAPAPKSRNLMIGVKPETKKRFKSFKKNNETDDALLNRLIDVYESESPDSKEGIVPMTPKEVPPQAGGKNATGEDTCAV